MRLCNCSNSCNIWQAYIHVRLLSCQSVLRDVLSAVGSDLGGDYLVAHPSEVGDACSESEAAEQVERLDGGYGLALLEVGKDSRALCLGGWYDVFHFMRFFGLY